MDYKKYNDYELVYQVRENDSIAYDILMKKYSLLAKKYAAEYYAKNKSVGIEKEDLYQEGMLGVIMALNDYNSNDTVFYTYALLCMKREMERLIKTAKRKKHKALNEAISLSSTVSFEDDMYLEDVLSSPYRVEDDLKSIELSRFLNNLKYELPDEDSIIYELRINSFNNREIAELLGTSCKFVDNRLRKIRKFLKQHKLSFGY